MRDPARAGRGGLRTPSSARQTSRRAILRAPGRVAAPPRPRRHAPRPPRRPRPPAHRAARRRDGARARARGRPAGLRQRRGGAGADRRRRARRRSSCAPSARCVRDPLLSDFEILNVHPSLLPRWRGRGADRARDHGRGRGDRGVDHAPGAGPRRRPGGPAGPRCRSPRRTTTPRSRPGWRTLGADLLLRALDERPPWREQDEDGATYAEKLTAADRTLDPTPRPRSRSASSARCTRTSARACAQPDGVVPRRAPRAGGGGRRARAARGPAARRAGRCPTPTSAAATAA